MSESDSNKAKNRRPEWGEIAVIASYGDLARDPKLSVADTDAVAELLTELADYDARIVFRVKSWLLDPDQCDEPKMLDPHPAAESVFTGTVLKESEKALQIRQSSRVIPDQWFPKSQLVRYELAPGVGEIESKRIGLDAFAADGAGAGGE